MPRLFTRSHIGACASPRREQLRPALRPVRAQPLREPFRGGMPGGGISRDVRIQRLALAQVAAQHRVDESGGASPRRLSPSSRRHRPRRIRACAHPRARTAPPTGARAPADSSDLPGCDEQPTQNGLVTVKAAYRAEGERAHRRHQLARRRRERSLQRRIERHTLAEDAHCTWAASGSGVERRRRSWFAKLAPASGCAFEECRPRSWVCGPRAAGASRAARRARRPRRCRLGRAPITVPGSARGAAGAGRGRELGLPDAQLLSSASAFRRPVRD